MAIITLVERSQIELMQHHTIQYIAATLAVLVFLLGMNFTVALKVITTPL
ncbi:Transposase, IS30 family [Lacticaseibacillus paracasei subsp. tolerans Lpl7]|jgi:hypothetical protein|uniref:Transposase n=1 Tax=Lacticaseibacillus paracasei TaxID=1597 RepID=A0ABD6W104_LACPA|nr:Mobile element protein [Lacticaseibacillus paracasei]EPC12063.1 Transposase, IS30 family [Lacticaseibacillus paracasei subsp. tolerans Lpl7]EPC22104.1 Transposase, IS30 family [Lacticaseibacillus paracasei subsp. paracasei Lpp17]EPC84537.1 transposase PrcB [Lacticaseibacillus paracasei subsp. paracasei Lpp43]EPD00128.1 transposase PrcB [Lacticaseibacillus paracasei subsp. paracasei Lpp125]OAU77577.1 transposase [Lacticaseibacillus rhamnosus]BEJ52814.1 hypothetical protein Ltb232_09900 [Len